MKSKVRRATGCITCRQRKVKCDETPEKCNNCENMGLQCTYISNDSAKSVSFRPLKIIPNQEFTEAGISRKRAQRACWQCRRKKCKCSTELPMCKRCRKFGYDCQYPPTKRATTKRAKYQLDDRISTPNPLEVLSQRLILQKANVLQYIDIYFTNMHELAVYGFLHRETLTNMLDEGNVPEVLLKSLCGVAAKLLAKDSDDIDMINMWMKDVEHEIMQNLWRLDVPYIQSLVFLITHVNLHSNPSKAWMLLSLASRAAYALQLNYEKRSLSAIKQESRRRLMWAIYICDKLYSGGISEFTLCRREDIHVQLPCKDSMFKFGISATTPTLDKLMANEVSESVDTRAYLLKSIDFRDRILRYTKHVVLQKLQPWAPNSTFWEIRTELNNFEKQLPEYLRLDSGNYPLNAQKAKSRSFIALRTGLFQHRYDLYRIMIPNLRESVSQSVLQEAPSDFIQLCRTECVRYAQGLSTFWRDLKAIDPDFYIQDGTAAYLCTCTIIFATQFGYWITTNQEITSLLMSNLKLLDKYARISTYVLNIQKDMAELIRHSQYGPLLNDQLANYSGGRLFLEQRNKKSRHILSVHHFLSEVIEKDADGAEDSDSNHQETNIEPASYPSYPPEQFDLSPTDVSAEPWSIDILDVMQPMHLDLYDGQYLLDYFLTSNVFNDPKG